MTPVFSFVAYSNTGKTTYIEKLISELSSRGLRVGALKHDAHEFEIDKPGKDSWRFAQAGAAVVAVASQTKCALIEYRPVSFADAIARFENVDLILVEGWHAEGERKIAIWRANCGSELKLSPGECIAVVSDTPIKTGKTPLFPLDNVRPMADFLESLLPEKQV